MTNTNTDIVVGLIVDGVLNSMKAQLDGNVPDAVFDTIRTDAANGHKLSLFAVPSPLGGEG